MGSSAMGASSLRNKLTKAGLSVQVIHCAIEDIPKDATLVVTHQNLVLRAKLAAPNAEIVGITNFVGAPEYDQIVARF